MSAEDFVNQFAQHSEVGFDKSLLR
jgi:hypothetical protein